KVQTAFLSAVCGCVLGKPLEVRPTLDQIRAAASAVGGWPLNYYVSEAMLVALGRRHISWRDSTRGNITYATSDDDINYKSIGMLLLEQHGRDFTRDDLREMWYVNLPAGWQFGPERTLNLRATQWSMQSPSRTRAPLEEWVAVWNPKDEF